MAITSNMKAKEIKMKKHTSEKPYLAVHFTKMCFLNLLKKKLWD